MATDKRYRFKRVRNFIRQYPKDGWEVIAGYDHVYKAHPDGLILSTFRNCVIPGQIDNEGYVLVTLLLNGKKTKRRVHRLVAQVFIPNPENKPQVNHLDFNKQNNAVSNLVWSTSKEDAEHKVAAGRQAKGKSFPIRKGVKIKKKAA